MRVATLLVGEESSGSVGTLRIVPAGVQPLAALRGERGRMEAQAAKQKICDYCGVETEAGKCCDACRQERTCTRCGEFDELTAVGNARLCDACIDTQTFFCDDCDERYLNSDRDSHEIQDCRIICDRCIDHYACCDDCGDYQEDDNNMIYDDNHRYCQSCYDDHLFTCSVCEQIFHWDNRVESHGNSCCADCAPADSGGIHDHDYKPDAVFHAAKTDRKVNSAESENPDYIHYGLEMETANYKDLDAAVEAVTSHDKGENDFYLKEDGSLPDDSSFEIVFHPRTFESWLEYKPTFDALGKTIRENGGESFNCKSCGLHIHRSRADLSAITISKLIYALVKFEGKVIKVAQRKSEQWASFNFSQNNGNDKLYYKSVTNGDIQGNRYVALNLQNKSTIEFRVFRGTLKVDTIYASIEFCDALVQWVKSDISIALMVKANSAVLWRLFINFIVKSQSYKLLLSYLERKELIPCV